jgi:L-alanine-DL-glutamate epimerase-like enolase superfamily enzyme
MVDGRIPVPCRPGLGVDIDEAHLRKVALTSTRGGA